MDFLQSIYQVLIDFILSFVYLFYKLGQFLAVLVQFVLIPINFIKDVLTGLDFSKTIEISYAPSGVNIITQLNNLGLPVLIIFSLFFIIMLWRKVKEVF